MTYKCNYRSRCNTIALFTLLHIGQKIRGSDASVQFHHQSVENKYHLSETFQDEMEQMDSPKDQKLIVRLPSNTLLKYTSYKDVSILHFRVPLDSRAAYFSFKAFEESKSAFQRKCKPKDVTLHLKANSFPVISPENITFPKNFLISDERFKVYNLEFLSDQTKHRIDIQSPQIGSWFAVAFVSWTDPNNERIEQQGLSSSCDTLLLAELSVLHFYPSIINSGQVTTGNLTSFFVNYKHKIHNASNSTSKRRTPADNQTPAKDSGQNDGNNMPQRSRILKQHENQRQELKTPTKNISYTLSRSSSNNNDSKSNAVKFATNNEKLYKFYVPDNVGVATARLAFNEVCMGCPDISFITQANAFPLICRDGQNLAGNEYNYLHRSVIRPNQTKEISIKFYVQANTWHYALLNFVSSADDYWMAPNNEYMSTLTLNLMKPKLNQQNGKNNLSLAAHNVSYTLQIDFEEFNLHNESSKIQPQAENECNNNWKPVRISGINFYRLLRQSYHEFFMFDYDLEPDDNGTVPALLNLTAHYPAGFAFDLGEVYDIGGTLTFAVSMKPELRFSSELKPISPTKSPPLERGGILAEKLVSRLEDAGRVMGHEQLPRGNQSMQIIVCMHLGVPGIPTWPDKCRYGQRLLPASSIINNTDIMGLIHVPFPESGFWFVTMGLFCHGAETARGSIIDSVKDFVRQHGNLLHEMRNPCACAGNAKRYAACIGSKDCLAGMNETETLKVKECIMDSKCTTDYLEMTHLFQVHHRSATEQQFALDNCNTSVVFSISSSPCVAGRCGRFGRCYHYMSGGFVFSTCVCNKGYRGWDCTESSQVPSSMSILMASLLLTLSNLLFIPSIYMAFRRQYYTEGAIYFFAMFFSIFYHACDSGEDEYSFCLVKISVLQFCDFYCGLLAIWVTLIAMANIPPQYVSLLNMFGAILLAFGTELNKQSLWVFLAPALTGISLISTSWGIRCAKTRKWFPARRYLTIFMPLGMVLVMIGLVCYAFLQTKQNYHIVHSIWHMVMAISIMCLLPSRKTFMPKL
ncbi:uncharacterized protein LOC135441260 isoform X2 [Drosophila montana]